MIGTAARCRSTALVRDEGARVTLTGELDVAGFPDVVRELAPLLELPDVVVDVADLTFLALRPALELLELQQHACSQGCRLVLTPGPRPVDRALELARILILLRRETSDDRGARGDATSSLPEDETRRSRDQASGAAPSAAGPDEWVHELVEVRHGTVVRRGSV